MRIDYGLPRAAVIYADSFGFAAFPCRLREKTPLTQHGCKDATKHIAQLRAWWERWPSANIGIATGAVSGVVVLDADPRHGSHQSLVGLMSKYGELPSTPTVLTGGGGVHFYFRAPDNTEIHNSVGLLGAGLDIRGLGGYVIAPPSWHPSGEPYRWAPEACIGEIELAPLPAWLIALLVSPQMLPASDQVPLTSARTNEPISQLDLMRLAVGVSEGQRDWQLFRLACYLRRRGYPREQANQIVVDAAGRCRPPFPTRAALRKVDSAWRYRS